MSLRLVTAAFLVAGCAAPGTEVSDRPARMIASPILDIAGLEGDSSWFVRTTAASRLDDGRIAIVDAGTGTIAYFSPDGHWLYRAGRLGEGPGEFRQPARLLHCGGDSLFVRDVATERISVLDSRGDFHRSFSFGPDRRPGPVYCNGSGTFLAILLPPEASGPPDPDRSEPLTGTAIITNADGDSLASISNIDIGINAVLGRVTSFDVAPDAILIGTGADGTVQRFSLHGQPQNPLHFPARARVATDSLYDAEIDRLVAMVASPEAPGMDRIVREMLMRSPRPESTPAYRQVFADPNGWTWLVASLPTDPATRIIGLSPDGIEHTVDIPVRIEVFEIRNGFLVGRTGDRGEVQHVQVYQIVSGNTGTN